MRDFAWECVRLVVVCGVVAAAAWWVVRRLERADVWAGLRTRVAETQDAVDDAIADAVDVLDGWPTDTNEPDDELYCDCGECWPQTPTGLPRRPPPLFEIERYDDMTDDERYAEIGWLHELVGPLADPPVIPGRDQ